ncbi:MAG: cysteine--1-D-myo-inosityl 2-amino-2-deoxy-alpha-D-glucopyranoside ligase, partial [Actinomycetota bacterium]|nr:cysteine--1-D-myo-inosityl 2-amino-2-deoxy-alpha-D-glucopyranoside ligase [Actinomycetota bacterium]
EDLLAGVRRLLADDLDTVGALAAVDRWAEDALTLGGDDPAAPPVVQDILDALLGIAV